MAAAAVALTVNGVRHAFDDPSSLSLLDVLRGRLGLTATRFGCGQGHCGACHVLVDGKAVASCATPVWSLDGRAVTTLEGLGDEAHPHPLQVAFIDEQAMQCGYCISGVIMTAAALLADNPDPSDVEMRAALDGNLCRCGSHNRILRAVRKAAAQMRAAAHG
jgi:nicotinate dehydrogenase subunit A